MVLSESQKRTLRAAMDRIVPEDDFPGAWEAGCGDFVESLLEQDLVDRNLYRQGLDSLEREASATYGKTFDSLSGQEQDELLSAIEVGSVTSQWPISAGKFFRSLVQHTMEGYYGNPQNGGHRNADSWRMIGFEVTG